MAVPPDLILYNGSLHTLDETLPFATAVAKGNKISALGADRDILGLAGPSTRTKDLKKKLVLPVFCDTHFYFYEWALNYDSIDFSKTTRFSGMEKAIREKAAQVGPGQWVLGQGFNESEWPENKMPDRKDLDRAAPDNPVCIWPWPILWP